ncbi:hypothetical protein GYH30_052911 [Glycine max]|uniref:F-box domain-containing protein n=1 Tax=Glycine max TaxID=3847 RepID=A0A0R0EX41_SOYBN|nr:hypothetical protein GYH30_052911 [Glycine max]
MDNIEPGGNVSLFNLQEPVLDCILKLLSPMGLIRMPEVCTFFRDRCGSDPLWEVHMKKKWGGVIGDVAYKEWQRHITKAKEKGINQSNQHNIQNGSVGSFRGNWPMLYLRSYLEDCRHLNSSLVNSFMMTLYFSLENGNFWFPAQTFTLRAPPVDTPACDGHMSDCLQDLKPGDHIEIEWKASRDIPYCRFHATASLIRC